MTLNKRGLNQYDLIIGGEETTAQFPLHKFLNLEHRENGSDQAEVIITFKPMDISFRPNKSMTSWVTSTSTGLCVTNGATVDWDSQQVLVRFRLKVSNYEEDTTPVLMLEALALDNRTWGGLAATRRRMMSSNGSSAILLWAKPCLWYSSLPEYKLPTAPGILRLTLDICPPLSSHAGCLPNPV